MAMILNERLADIEAVSRGSSPHPALEEETECGDTQRAVRILADAYEHLRKRDPLYGDRRRLRALAPPPASVPPC
jgi:hypothetical protein